MRLARRLRSLRSPLSKERLGSLRPPVFSAVRQNNLFNAAIDFGLGEAFIS